VLTLRQTYKWKDMYKGPGQAIIWRSSTNPPNILYSSYETIVTSIIPSFVKLSKVGNHNGLNRCQYDMNRAFLRRGIFHLSNIKLAN
jgi:hypothetical protein